MFKFYYLTSKLLLVEGKNKKVKLCSIFRQLVGVKSVNKLKAVKS